MNGNSVEYTTYTIDGVYSMNSGNLANINILPVVDGIAEFSVLKDSYSAKYGIAGSGQVVVETKSGSETFHGSAWDYLRNNAFDAFNYFSTSTPALHQNIYGYTLGGSVMIPKLFNTNRLRKTFFFASNQWQAISGGSGREQGKSAGEAVRIVRSSRYGRLLLAWEEIHARPGRYVVLVASASPMLLGQSL